jgi:hypothetical protein
MSNIFNTQPNVTTNKDENCDWLHRDDANQMQEIEGK